MADADDAEGAIADIAGESDPEKAARLARLARKAESARLARLRHKQFVADKQSEVGALAHEEETLLANESTAAPAALATAKSELRKALSPEQLQVNSDGRYTPPPI